MLFHKITNKNNKVIKLLSSNNNLNKHNNKNKNNNQKHKKAIICLTFDSKSLINMN